MAQSGPKNRYSLTWCGRRRQRDERLGLRQFTDKHAVGSRLGRLHCLAGFEVESAMPAYHSPRSGSPGRRSRCGREPSRLVETRPRSLRQGPPQLPDHLLPQTGYNCSLASGVRRSWRIGQRGRAGSSTSSQKARCRNGPWASWAGNTTASLERAFERGPAAMAGEDANVEIALARNLVERMDEGDVRGCGEAPGCSSRRHPLFRRPGLTAWSPAPCPHSHRSKPGGALQSRSSRRAWPKIETCRDGPRRDWCAT